MVVVVVLVVVVVVVAAAAGRRFQSTVGSTIDASIPVGPEAHSNTPKAAYPLIYLQAHTRNFHSFLDLKPPRRS